MGNNWSSLEEQSEPDLWWPPEQPQTVLHTTDSTVDEPLPEGAPEGIRGRVREEELEAFKQELAKKRALRHEALAALQAEMKQLRSKVEEERNLRLKAEEERDKLKMVTEGELQRELEKEKKEKKELLEERERLREEVEEKAGLARQVQALKDVSEIGKEMLRIRELQVRELKKKLVEINISSVMAPPEDLRIEYEKQIENIRKLRTLYEERAAATLLEHRRELEREEARVVVLETKLSDLQKETDEFKEEKKMLEEKIEKLEKTIQQNEDELETTKDELFSKTVQNRSLNSQMTLINNLFSQMIISPEIDLDRLTRLLKEHHGLITDLTSKGDSNEVAALLVDLAGQIEREREDSQINEGHVTEVTESAESETEIASNLTKVWRVMMELLSHHQSSTHTELAGGAESCYKCVQTPAGPRSVISVSQTFLTLKDLILEKNKLVQEVGRLKTLNNHLEHRLGSQEKRLSVVTTELRKTWSVVNKLKAQHKQLHTHEKILRYELQQKRCMLTELKQELEHCRDKWERARKKNSETEEDWKKLRKEFAARKTRKESNSAESGYEEDDVPSPSSESNSQEGDSFEVGRHAGCEELSEEDIEHSDGNSFDTVIDLLDIACLESQADNEPFVVCEAPSQSSVTSPSLLPLSESEFTEGLDQIESEDLAAVLDVQYQNQLLGADYNLSLPSSSASSPIPTENDNFASSELDISEEDLPPNGVYISSSPFPAVSSSVPEDTLLFGSNSSKNISIFLDGLFVKQPPNTADNQTHNLFLNIPTTSQTTHENGSATPLVNNEHCYEFPTDSTTPLVSDENTIDLLLVQVHKETCCSQSTASEVQLPESKGMDQELLLKLLSPPLNDQENASRVDQPSSSECDMRTREEIINAREERLRKLEQQCRSLVSRVTSTSFRSELISNKLDELHLSYGSSEETSYVEETSGDSLKLEPKVNSYKFSESEAAVNSCKIESSENNLSPEDTTPDIAAASLPKISSQKSTKLEKNRTPEEVLEARTVRLKRLEDQCKSLFSKMSATSSRSESLSNKLDELHASYGSSEQNTTTIDQAIVKVSPCERQNIDTKVPDLATESKEILNKCSRPGPSVEPIAKSTVNSNKGRTPEEILDARAERFKRLEEQCKSLVSKMTATSLRSEIISNKLDELHSCYGSEDISDNDDISSCPKESSTNVDISTSAESSRTLVSSAERSNQTEQNTNETCAQSVYRIESPSTTNLGSKNADQPKRTPEEILEARSQRLNRLEEQCKSLFTQMSATSQRSNVISNRLEELHEQYGQSEQSSSASSSAPENEMLESSTITENNTNPEQN